MARKALSAAEKVAAEKKREEDAAARKKMLGAMTPEAKKEFLNKERAANFKRLGTARLNAALEKIRLIANVAGPGYVYTPEQVAVIERSLTAAVAETMAKFSKTKKADANKVEL